MTSSQEDLDVDVTATSDHIIQSEEEEAAADQTVDQSHEDDDIVLQVSDVETSGSRVPFCHRLSKFVKY